MERVGSTISFVAALLFGAAFLPGLYLSLRASADPEGLVDGLLRVGWLTPLFWIVGLWIAGRFSFERLLARLALQVPIALLVGAALTFFFGFLNDRKVIVSQAHPPTEAARLRFSRGEPAYVEGELGPLVHLARLGRKLPPAPIPPPPKTWKEE
ncbi:MAG: hypothetical protein D6729_17365 [Deltaproteobacteria bacterium]|nr:MAG: hypothetical protein D6729_17365 [Deltaproteobacteria bacterium]